MFDGPQPLGIDVFGWAMTAAWLFAAAASTVWLVVSLVGLFEQRERAGEHLFAAGGGVVLALFLARVWYGFRTLPDWRVALEVPLRAKVFSAAGAAASASLAAGALALVLFAICAKVTFLRFMEAAGAGDVGKVQVLFSAGVTFFYFTALWYLFEGMMELREGARTALRVVFVVTVAAAVAAWVADAAGLHEGVGNHGVRDMGWFLGGVALVGLALHAVCIRGAAEECFRAHEI